PWAVAAAAIIVALLSLRWLIAQAIRRPRGGDWQLAPDTSTGGTHIGSDTAAEPLGEEIADYPGVHSATARLTGPRQHPHLYLWVSTDDRADITTLRHRIDTEAIPRLTQALNLPDLPADLLLRLDTSSGTRTR
ncbi:MAG: alkaline shock response membrane anchor protein AmaP, partial [Pseudonocardiaceae bacterium]